MSEEIQKRFNLSEVLESMPNPPHTIELSQFKRGKGDVATSYKAKFKIETTTRRMGEEINQVLEDLRRREIEAARFDIEWAHTEFYKKFKSRSDRIEFTLSVVLMPPDVIHRQHNDEAEAISNVVEFIKESRREAKVAESVEGDIAA